MIAISVQSGSNGNCIYVETEHARLLFDAGVSGVTAEQRLKARGREIRKVDAVIISHDHADHARCAGVYQRKYGIPVYATQKTVAAADAYCGLGKFFDLRHFRAGETLTIKGVTIETVPTPHDGADGSIFVVASDNKRLGIMTDLGHVFPGLHEIVASLDGVFLESNYDPDMLARGPYPEFLKRRIRGEGGHISNSEAAELIRAASEGRLRWACLAHLSEQNNSPPVALRTHREIVGERVPLCVASRYGVSEVFEI